MFISNFVPCYANKWNQTYEGTLKVQSIFANDIQCLYDSNQKLASLLNDYNPISFVALAQSTVQELKMIWEAHSPENKKKLEKFHINVIPR